LKPITIRYLSGHDVAELALDNDEILDAIEASLRAQGNGETVIEPRMHLSPSPSVNGHFKPLLAPLDRDRPLAADVESILEHFSRPEFIELFR
jgi:alanine dehydrogenase